MVKALNGITESLQHATVRDGQPRRSRGRRKQKDSQVEDLGSLSEATLPVLLAKLQTFEVSNEEVSISVPQVASRRGSAGESFTRGSEDRGINKGDSRRGSKINLQMDAQEAVGTFLEKSGDAPQVKSRQDFTGFPAVDLPSRPYTTDVPNFPAPVLMVTVKDLNTAPLKQKGKKRRTFSGLPPDLIPPRKEEKVTWTVPPKDYYTRNELRFMQRTIQMQLNPLLAWRAQTESTKPILSQPQPPQPFLKKRAATAPTRIMSAHQHPSSSQDGPAPQRAQVASRSKSAFPSLSTRWEIRSKTPVLVGMPICVPTRVSRLSTPFELGSPLYRHPPGCEASRPGTKSERVLKHLSFARM
ncbi:hypothetical protein HDU67_004029 [Dinochytrium kinnereticum]|nr:hypothetical protein HDU67_004029 [Dinochytrium kinnereticum]